MHQSEESIVDKDDLNRSTRDLLLKYRWCSSFDPRKDEVGVASPLLPGKKIEIDLILSQIIAGIGTSNIDIYIAGIGTSNIDF